MNIAGVVRRRPVNVAKGYTDRPLRVNKRASSPRWTRGITLLALALTGPPLPADQPASGVEQLNARQARVYRDRWGVPHIYAATAEAGLYASGWMQAEDRLEQILKNYLLALGEYARAFGPGIDQQWIRSDLESQTWDHHGIARRHYQGKLNRELRAHLSAFVAGINGYMDAHAEEVPDWWGDRDVDVYMPVAFSRQFIWGWPAGQARQDLGKAGLEPNYDVDARASNEIAIAPWRTTFGNAALIIDPHLAWFGRQRYWELRLHAGDIHISGFATAGFPYVNLGHNRHVAWAHTTGGPDTADVYRLKLNQQQTQYRFDGRWIDLQERKIEIDVLGEPQPRQFQVQYSHHGPLVARDQDYAYAAAISYADEIGYLESKYWFMMAEDYRGAIKALEVRQIMPQNVMVADTGGNIYYQRTGRVPIRPHGYHWDAPVDGTTSATLWRGIHPVADLLSLTNPPAGYMQNCNVGPDVMLVDSPLTPETTVGYLYNQPKHSIHQRGASALALLQRTQRFSEQQLLELAVDRTVYQHQRWTGLLQASAEAAELSDHETAYLNRLVGWNGQADADSNGALLYYFWRTELEEMLDRKGHAAMERRVNDYLDLIRTSSQAPAIEPVTLDDRQQLLRALRQATAGVMERFGGLEAVFGDVFRVGRLDAEDNVSWPVGGGSLTDVGMATLRSVGFGQERPDGTRWGERGQTSTAVVILSNPIRSYTQPPIGQSDRSDSPHYRDQAEQLFSPAKLKPSWFTLEALRQGNVRSTEIVEYQ